MNHLTKEVTELANSLLNNEDFEELTEVEALKLAVKIQQNRILSDAFVVREGVPSALEAIAMELGASVSGTTIKDAIYNLNEKTEN